MQKDQVLAPEEVEPLLSTLRGQGLMACFRCRPNGVIECLECGHENPADEMPLMGLYSVDAPTEEGTEVVTVLQCAECTSEGYLVFAQWPLSSRDEAMCLAELCSDQ